MCQRWTKPWQGKNAGPMPRLIWLHGWLWLHKHMSQAIELGFYDCRSTSAAACRPEACITKRGSRQKRHLASRSAGGAARAVFFNHRYGLRVGAMHWRAGSWGLARRKRGAGRRGNHAWGPHHHARWRRPTERAQQPASIQAAYPLPMCFWRRKRNGEWGGRGLRTLVHAGGC